MAGEESMEKGNVGETARGREQERGWEGQIGSDGQEVK